MAAERWDALILGGGVAGLSCATALAGAGRRVLVLEKSPCLGGRARTVRDSETGAAWDNGPHLFAGRCHHLGRFLGRLGRAELLSFPARLRMDFLDGRTADSLKIPATLGSRFGLLWAVWSLRGLRASDKWGTLRLRRALAAPDPAGLAAMTAAAWFESLGQSRQVQERLLDPLTRVLLNEPGSRVSAGVVAQVLRELLLGGGDAMRLGWSTVSFDELYVEPARAFISARGGTVLLSTEVTRLLEDDGRVLGAADVWGQRFLADAVVSTLPPWELKRLELPQRLRGSWEGLEASASAAVHIDLEGRVLDVPVAALSGATASWLLARDGAGGRGQRLSVVVSAGRDVLQASDAAFFDAAKRDLSRCLPDFEKARITGWKVVKEPEARLAQPPGTEERRPRPGQVLPGLSLAGDWTGTGLPATIESAAAGGERAAEELMQSHA
ncbi:MAG: FAD-dependent oxidoreductase [Elusimicrobia bacterium]|nr:FAD-dependent oxidoreductase [Elusimicrobiota bacterium]